MNTFASQARVRAEHKYQPQFQSHLGKPISQLLLRTKSPLLVHYHQLQFMADDTQFHKRYYLLQQSPSRIYSLIGALGYYFKHMAPPQPSLAPLDGHGIMAQRRGRQARLRGTAEQKGEGSGQGDKSEAVGFSDDVLDGLSGVSMAGDGSGSASGGWSYDTEVHDIYEPDMKSLESKFRAAVSLEGSEEEFLSVGAIRHSYLIIDFRKPVLHRQVDLAPQPSTNSTRQPKLSTNGQGEANNQGRTAQKRCSFMEYYDSLPRKPPSNLIKAYIKAKK